MTKQSFRTHPDSPCAQPAPNNPKTKKRHWSNIPPFNNNRSAKKGGE